MKYRWKHFSCNTLIHAEELELLTEWCAAYNVETLGQTDTSSLRPACRLVIEARQTTAMHWVLIAKDTTVSYSAFNASPPDIVQIGGVWTPPALRGKGYAKSVVAGSLLYARSLLVKRAILFTGDNNQAAQAVYRGIGFLPLSTEMESTRVHLVKSQFACGLGLPRSACNDRIAIAHSHIYNFQILT
ncbi:GNAT family N-acetyltransferase [Nostoc sp.]|uniref:GNAT family N-acetyltransferase n=1 Tax=Nostoc sp. TaxID=1180 RepID=UPI002FFC9F3F